MHDLFAICAPGLEPVVERELLQLPGASAFAAAPGGVAFRGSSVTLWLANLRLRTATRILLRVAEMEAPSLQALRHRASAVPWETLVRPGSAVRVKATCHRSRIYHSGAAEQRVREAITEAIGPARGAGDAEALVLVRIDRDVCTLSLDTSGELLHRRGYRLATAKAPLRETLAAAVLLIAGYDGSTPLVDPMCGSGTFAIEAALLATGTPPGSRRRFAFMDWPGFDAAAFERARAEATPAASPVAPILAFDRDAGAVTAAVGNAGRAGVAALLRVERRPISSLPPMSGPGLLVCNPPYGSRIGRGAGVRDLYAALGRVVRERLPGFRVALVTPDVRLASATGLPLRPASAPLPHGGLKIRVLVADPER